MLIIDSPFPPYAPVDRDVFEWPDLNVEGGHKLTGHPSNNITDYIWTKDHALHRDGDLPAAVNSVGSACFFAMDVKHRVSGAAEFVPARRGVLARRRFYLYGSTATKTVIVWSSLKATRWEKDGELHRDGDFPAYVQNNKTQIFYKVNVKHRINGPALIEAPDQGPAGRVKEGFFLYGKELSKVEFFRVNRLAIKYELPLWVPVIAEYFSFDFEKDGIGDFTKEAISAMGVDDAFLPVEWLIKLWNVTEEDLAFRKHGRILELDQFPKLISSMNKVLTYERTSYQKD